MSDELDTQQVDAPPGDTPPADTTSGADQSSDTPSGDTSKTDTPPGDAPKYEVPAKFLNADGTPDLAKLAKSYSGLEKKLAKSFVPAASVDEFEFEFGDGVEMDQEKLGAFKAQLLEQGFTKSQYAFMMEQYQTNLAASTHTADKTEATLKEVWGNDYTNNTAAAQRAFEEFAPSDASPHDPVWNHPAVMQLLARMGGELGEDSLAGKSGGGNAPALTRAEVDTLMSSKDYWDNAESQKQVSAWYAKNAK